MKMGDPHAHSTVKPPNQANPQYAQNHFHGDFSIIQAADFGQVNNNIESKPQRWQMVERNICKKIGEQQKADKRQIKSCASVPAF